MMEENKYEIGVQKEPQRGHVLLIHSMWFLFVPRVGYGGQGQDMEAKSKDFPAKLKLHQVEQGVISTGCIRS